jgi:8-amino-7-oxononanoate synthase
MRPTDNAMGERSLLIASLEDDLASRRADGLWRTRRTLASAQGPRIVVDGRERTAFASNDYLGLANDPAIVAAVRDAALAWGVGAGASHLLAGHFVPHAELETALAQWVRPCDNARALTFSTGYLANLAILTALAGRRDAIFTDRLNHSCLTDGALLSRAELIRYPHRDVERLDAALGASKASRKLIATDAVFSMDGDLAPLPQLLELASAHDAWLVVDDAHGFGVLGGGRGTLAHFGIADARIVYMGTLGKAAGVAGAFVAAHEAVVETLVQVARPYVFTTAAPPLLAAALLASLAIIRDGDDRRAHLRALTERFESRMRELPWRRLPSRTAIQGLLVGDNASALALSEALWHRGFWAPAIRPPTVPAGTARLRITLTAAHSHGDVDALADALADIARSSDPRAGAAPSAKGRPERELAPKRVARRVVR